jgi:small-conductance mechanosensitive channel
MARVSENGRVVHKSEIDEKAPLFGRWALGSLMALGVLVAIGAVLIWRTNDAMANLPYLQQRDNGSLAGQQKTIVDESPWTTAKALAALAVTEEELVYARQAEHLADHDVDQAFAAALHAANLQQKTLTGASLAAQQRVTDLETAVTSDQASVKQLTAKGGDDLEVAQAQLSLDQDELADAREDLARVTGDQRGEIQQELSARQADMKRFDASQGTGEVAVISVKRYRTLDGLIGAWRRQNERYKLLENAKATAAATAAKFSAEHDRLESQAKDPDTGSGDAAAKRVAGLNRLSLERQLMSIYDDRVDTEQRLAGVYDKWAAQVALQHRIIHHLILIQVMWILAILILAIVLNAVVQRIAEQESLDQRRMRTLSRIFRLVIQVLALMGILLVVFGAPSQISTFIGLATAGLTVALQDFILAFAGWFILMSRSGIAIGDVVEIDGVAGDVVEIGLFRTTLLETGNWTANGHPTGRRVAFNNKYAISGKFFNFSTTGQWMWDEVAVPVPQDEDTYTTIEQVRATVASATQADAEQAEKEWRQASNFRGLAKFSAEPAVNLRPSATGVDLVVRYVTRASSRLEQRNKLYQCVLDTMRTRKEQTAPDVETSKRAQ